MDFSVVCACNRWRTKTIDAVSVFLSWIPFLVMLWVVTALSFFFFDRQLGQQVFWGVTFAMALLFSINEVLIKRILTKWWGVRLRPYMAHPDKIVPVGRRHSDSSFPSSHVAGMMSGSTVLVFYHPSLWPLLLLATALVGFSRLHNGMHYLSDLLAGAVLGMMYGALGIYLSTLII
ncbi:phosphatase PAP2 family protein [Patescibacteria group bacterium]|nr:MAG: phosphatase PAP2 family protein [Patescibacteria group bacterium]